MNQTTPINPRIRDFILFCAQREDKGWPALYDEMCRVAGSRLFQNLGHADLKTLGLSFSLNNLENTLRTVETVMSGR